MEHLTPWLMVALAALLVVCVVLFYHLRQVESATEARTVVFGEALDQALNRSAAVAKKPALGSDWRPAAIRMARGGYSAAHIARELEAPVGEVELVIALDQPCRSR